MRSEPRDYGARGSEAGRYGGGDRRQGEPDRRFSGQRDSRGTYYPKRRVVPQGPPTGEPSSQQTPPTPERRKLEVNDARRYALERERDRLAHVAIDSEKYDPKSKEKIQRSAKAIGYPPHEIGARIDEHRLRSRRQGGPAPVETNARPGSVSPVREIAGSEREGRGRERTKDRRGRGGDAGGFKSKKEREAEEREERELERQWAAKKEKEAKLLAQAREREMPQQRAANQVELPSMLRMSDLSQLLRRSMCAFLFVRTVLTAS